MKKKIKYNLLLYSLLGIQLLVYSCNKESFGVNNIIEISNTKAKVQFDEIFFTQLNLNNGSSVEQIKVVNKYNRIVVVGDIQFPYTFIESVDMADEDGVVMYSFYSLYISGNALEIGISYGRSPLI